MPRRFWAFEEGSGEGLPATLRLEGPIAEESWWGDEVTPADFRAELDAHPGDLTVYINSPGGDVVAGSLIYSMLREHKGRVTVRIDGLAASAASVVAMAGDRIEMAPTAYMMIHNASTIAWGDNREMRRAAEMLDEINRGIRTAYALKTGKSERELAKLMDEETWMSATTALDEGFIDAICYAAEPPADPEEDDDDGDGDGVVHAVTAAMKKYKLPAVAFSARRQLENTTRAAAQRAAAQKEHDDKEADEALRARLRLLSL